MSRWRAVIIWAVIVAGVTVPLIAAAVSPLLAWRDPVYIGAGFAGIVAMVLLFIQPLLVGGYLPGLPAQSARRIHRLVGGLLVIAIIAHVAGLWITSPPDVIDALLFSSPTPFSVWGVVAMWAVFATALLATFRRHLRPRTWRRGHATLALVIVIGSVVHAILIEGTMETVSKVALCALVIAATIFALFKLRVFANPTKPR